MKIKFTRSILHKNSEGKMEHCEAGSIKSLPDGDAKFYILAQDATEATEADIAAASKGSKEEK